MVKMAIKPNIYGDICCRKTGIGLNSCEELELVRTKGKVRHQASDVGTKEVITIKITVGRK